MYDLYVTDNVILGKTDTMIDLSLDLAGGVVAGLISLPMLKRRNRGRKDAESH